jgi:hypothetical protein
VIRLKADGTPDTLTDGRGGRYVLCQGYALDRARLHLAPAAVRKAGVCGKRLPIRPGDETNPHLPDLLCDACAEVALSVPPPLDPDCAHCPGGPTWLLAEGHKGAIRYCPALGHPADQPRSWLVARPQPPATAEAPGDESFETFEAWAAAEIEGYVKEQQEYVGRMLAERQAALEQHEQFMRAARDAREDAGLPPGTPRRPRRKAN